TQSAAGLAAFRRGDLAEAEKYYQAALKLDPNDVGALRGLASIYSALSKFASARVLTERAYRLRPDDPALMRLHADTLKGSEHIAALEKVLAGLDAGSDEARDLRGHIADDRALGDRKTRKLVSAYGPTQIKLLPLRNGADRRPGLGLRVELNRRQTVTLLLDT